MSLNPLSLATSPERVSVLAAARGQPPFFHPRLKVWVVLDAGHVRELLLEDRLVVPEIHSALTSVEQHFGLSLPNLKWLADELPLVLEGTAHKHKRGALAKHISAERRSGSNWREPVRELVRAAFAKPGSIEVFRGLLLPIADIVFASLTHVEASLEPLSLTRVFDHYAGYRHLESMEAGIGAVRDRMIEANIPEHSLGTHLALIIFGRDALTSSMGEGLIDFALECQGRRLDDRTVRQPRLFGGVAVGERLVTETFEFAGATFEEGQRIRLCFQGFSYLESPADRLGIFGAGDHSCLGRTLALDVWSLFTEELRKSPLTLSSVAFDYQPNSMFTMPRSINLELTSS